MLAALLFLVPAYEAGRTVLVAGMAALTILPGFLGWLSVHLHRLPADPRG